VRIDGWQRDQGTRPVLTMLSASDLWCLRQAGCEPAGIAGAFLSVETQATSSTVMSGLGGRKRVPNREFKDLTASVYEARRLALERLTRDARDLDATGLLGIDLVHQHRSGGSLPGLHITVHALADAIRRVGDSRLEPGALLIQAVQRNA
jgi:uncharacterized protein YbjQ (UPF0145 family)